MELTINFVKKIIIIIISWYILKSFCYMWLSSLLPSTVLKILVPLWLNSALSTSLNGTDELFLIFFIVYLKMFYYVAVITSTKYVIPNITTIPVKMCSIYI